MKLENLWSDLMFVRWNLMIVHVDDCLVDDCLLTVKAGPTFNHFQNTEPLKQPFFLWNSVIQIVGSTVSQFQWQEESVTLRSQVFQKPVTSRAVFAIHTPFWRFFLLTAGLCIWLEVLDWKPVSWGCREGIGDNFFWSNAYLGDLAPLA